MTWQNIIGQEKITDLLQKAITENRLAHAYCFWGIEGIGKEAIALEFAKVLNCTNPVKEGVHIKACGVCSSCMRAASLQHPNIQPIFSIPAGKSSGSKGNSAFSALDDEQLAEVQSEIQEKATDPYHKISLPNATQIKIASIRDIKHNLSMPATHYGRRCVIIFRADEMNGEAANAFLKTLEEPHDNVTIILVTSKINAMLPTILSRCQQLRFEPLDEEAIIHALIEKKGLERTEAGLVAAYAEGSYSNALEYLDKNMEEFRENVVNAFRSALKKKIYRLELLEYLDPLFKQKDKKKYETFLLILMAWLRDALTLQKSSNKTNVINQDQVNIIERFAINFQEKNIGEAIIIVEEAVTQVRKNINVQLILLNMYVKIRKILL